MHEAIVVGLIVAAAVVYAIWALLPAALRLRLAQGVHRRVSRPGMPATDYSLDLGEEGRAALAELLRRGRAAGIFTASGAVPGYQK